jgi:hypothetical protein
MEIRQNVNRVPKQQGILIVAVLFALALALLSWRLLSFDAAPLSNTSHGPATSSSQAPDAQDRNAQIRSDQYRAETHGH